MKIIWLLLILSGLSSCCSSQKTTHSVHTQTDQRNDVHTEQSAQSRQQESVSSHLSSLLNNRWQEVLETASNRHLQWHIRLYDTDKPIDSLRGERPLLAEVTVSQEEQAESRLSRQEDRDESARLETTREKQRTDSLHTHRQQETQIASETQTHEQKRNSRRLPGVILLATIVGVAVLLYLLLNRRT